MEVLNFCGEHPVIMCIILFFAYCIVECVMVNIANMFVRDKPEKKKFKKKNNEDVEDIEK